MLFDLKLQPAQIAALETWTDPDGATLTLRVEGAALIAEQGDDRAAWAFDGTELTDAELDSLLDGQSADPGSAS